MRKNIFSSPFRGLGGGLILTAALLVSTLSFAGNGGDKGKDKKKKPQTMNNCPGKQCGKKQSPPAKG